MIYACTGEETIVFVEGEEPLETIVETDLTLKQKAKFKIGAAIKTSLLESEPEYVNALVENYNQITAEFEMKMEVLWGSPDYNFEPADYITDFAETNNMDVHGHSLVWYRSFPAWFTLHQENDTIAYESKIKEFITTVGNRYKGKVRSWDVVNEVISDSGGLRDEEFINAVFNDPIAFYGRCFQYAKDVDPDALLFYNDYGIANLPEKRASIKSFIERLLDEGYPIDGIGCQFHYSASNSLESIKTAFDDIASLGLLMHISELDMKMNTSQSDNFILTSATAKRQGDIYEFIVNMYEDLPENQKYAITTWGVTDKYTWLTDFWHPKEYPLLLDSNYNKKLSYLGFLNSLR